ncbi:MAG: DUF3499 family protein [Acidimicrobiales bacterium]
MDRPRLCARPGCGAPAIASLTYHYAGRTAWIDNLDDERQPSALDLCGGHGADMRVPLGWALDDRRTPIIPLRPPLAV